MRALILHPLHNTAGKRDATGAFIPEAKAYAKHLTDAYMDMVGVDVVGFDNSATKLARRRQVEAAIRSATTGTVAMFCHGLSRGIQTGHDIAHVSTLADALAASCGASRRLVVTLYACDAADSPWDGPGGDGGFADALRDALSERGVTGHVDAHVTTGHTTKNPYVRRFYMDGVAVGTGGDWLVAPGSPKWRAWIRALKGDMRFRFPWLTPAEIDGAL